MAKPPKSTPVLPRDDSSTDEGHRCAALATACDDLQAQFDAGERSYRHVDRDLTLLHDTLRTSVHPTDVLDDLQRHLHNLRHNMREQQSALLEVRRAAIKVCSAVSHGRQQPGTLAEKKRTLERTHAALLNEHARLRETPRDHVGHVAHGEHLRNHLSDLREFRKHLPSRESSDQHPKK
jgi:hypothetical protein